MRRIPADLVVVFAYLLLGALWIFTMPDLARLDRDEGFNLMKADLVQHGYRLYSEIWSDQPPLFTHLLVGWRTMAGDSDRAARLLVLILTCTGLASTARLARWMGAGRVLAGAFAVLLLIGARSYPKLSMAVMIGLPAISIALLSIVILRWSTTRKWGWAVVAAAGALMAASMQVKLFTFILIPMAVATYVIASREHNRLKSWRTVLDAVLWIIAFGLVTLLVGPFREPAWQQQLVQTHLRTGLPTDDTQLAALRSIVSRFLEDAPLMLAAAAGLWAAGQAAAWRCLPAIVWLLTSILVLSQANPLWGHHRVMFSIPAAMIAGVAAAELLKRWRRGERTRWPIKLAGVAYGLAIAYGLVQITGSVIGLGRGDDEHDPQILTRLRTLSQVEPRPWVISDDPHVVHAAGLLVPPETAVLSLKRLQRDLSEQRLAEIIVKYDPPVILLARHSYTPQFVENVTRGYELVLSKKKDRVRMFERRPSTQPSQQNLDG